jgi:serine/threonine protein kinase
MLTVGALLQYGKYQINDVLAVKGSSATYRATQCDLNQSVVLKTVVAEYLAVKVGIGRFLAEARRLAELQHPHIVRVGDCFIEQGRLFLVTDFLGGQSLAQKVAQGPISPTDALRYIRQIGQAIASMHQQGLLHRDIKPSNIMVSEDQCSATLVDFNIARSLLATPIGQPTNQTPDATSHQAQAISPVLGTEFIAPEPTLSPHLWTVAADIYALAATFYTLVTGKTPTGSWRNAFKEEQIFEQRPELRQAILTGMAMEMSERPASIAEWLMLLPENDSSIRLNGQASLEPTDLEPTTLVMADAVQATSIQADSVQIDSTPEPAPIVINDLDPTLAVLEHPQPLSLQPASNQKPSQTESSSPKRSRRSQRSSFVAASRPAHFPRKALLLSAIASGVGGVAFGFFMKTQIFSALILPSSLSNLTSPLTLPGVSPETGPETSPETIQETIQETFPPKPGSQAAGAPSASPSVEAPPSDLSPAGTDPIVPDASTLEKTDATAPTDAAVVTPTPSSLFKTPDSISNPATKGPANVPYDPNKDLPISSPTRSSDPSFDAANPTNLEPLPSPEGAETPPVEQSSAPFSSATQPTVP